MNDDLKTKKNKSVPLRSYALGVAVLWSLLIVISLIWNIRIEKTGTFDAARIEARTAFEKDIIYRRWNATHGGVYVPVTEKTQPNPYLDVPERDIITLLGKKLTKINPAYMTRQVHEIATHTHGVKGHITSLNPIRPANAPDLWETQALKAFKAGVKEVSSVEKMAGKKYMRLMRPLLTESSCLKCHAAQGYKLGDIRGGISASVPMASLLAIGRSRIISFCVVLGLFWLIGLAGIGFSTRSLYQQIHKRIGTEEALRESEAQIRSVLETVGAVIMVLSPDHRIMEFNRAAERTYGAKREDVLEKNYLDLFIPEEFHEPIMNDIQKVLSGTPTSDYENPVRSSDGKEYLFLWNVQRLLDHQGQAVGIIACGQDITDRKRAEEALRESEERFRTLAKVSPVGISRTNAEGHCRYVNERWCEIAGLTPEEAFGEGWKRGLHPDDRDRVFEEWYQAVEQNLPFKSEYRFHNTKGSTTWVIGQAMEERGPSGETKGYIGTITDINERKQAEEQIKASLKEKEVLLSEIHHRVKNNMQVIISSLRLRADKIEDKKYADMFKKEENQIRSMALIHEQLYQSKDFANIDFGEYVKSFVNGLFVSYGIDTNKVKLNIDIKDVSLDLENAIPCGLIINELVSNSLKYAFPYQGEGNISIILQSINEDEFELTVSDDGLGIPEDLDVRDTESMGLHIVKIIAEQTLEGKMELNRTEGTHFHFLLKRAKYKTRI